MNPEALELAKLIQFIVDEIKDDKPELVKEIMDRTYKIGYAWGYTYGR